MEFTANSGAQVTINEGDFEDVMALKATFEQSLLSLDIKIEDIFNTDISKLFRAVLLVDSSPNVFNAMWPLLQRCLYNKEKITKTTFTKTSARRDYYDIVVECVAQNLGPFYEGLFSPSGRAAALIKSVNGLKSK